MRLRFGMVVVVALIGSNPLRATGQVVTADPPGYEPPAAEVQPRRAPVDRSWVTLDLLGGLVGGARGRLFLTPPGKVRISVEAMTGWILLYSGYGAGLRAQIETFRRPRSATLVSPGLLVLRSPPQSLGWWGHDGTLTLTQVSLEVSWLGRLGDHFAVELGGRVGAAYARTDPGFELVPDLGVFIGIRI